MFGLAGFVLPAAEVRGFGTWFFQRKCELLDFEIKRSGEHPAEWEKKGASLFTVTNVTKYSRLRHFTNRLFNKIDGFCEQDCDPAGSFVVILDEHDQRSALISAAARTMYGNEPRRHLIEPPFHLQSHRYQTLQAADWIAGLVGRLGAIWVAPAEYSDNEPFRRYFEHRLSLVVYAAGVESGLRRLAGRDTRPSGPASVAARFVPLRPCEGLRSSRGSHVRGQRHPEPLGHARHELGPVGASTRRCCSRGRRQRAPEDESSSKERPDAAILGYRPDPCGNTR